MTASGWLSDYHVCSHAVGFVPQPGHNKDHQKIEQTDSSFDMTRLGRVPTTYRMSDRHANH